MYIPHDFIDEINKFKFHSDEINKFKFHRPFSVESIFFDKTNNSVSSNVFSETDVRIASAILSLFKKINKKHDPPVSQFESLANFCNELVADFHSFADADPIYYPFDVFTENEDIFPIVSQCAQTRYVLPQIPISYFYDVFQGEKVHTPSYVKWQTEENRRKNFVLSYKDENGKCKAVATINQMVMSIMLAFPINKIHINIIDLDSTLDFVNISGNLDSKLVTLISNNSELHTFTERIENLIKKASTTSGFNSAEEFNSANETIAFPYELILVANYNGMSFAHVEESMSSFFNNGSRFGVYFFLLNDLTTHNEGNKRCFLSNDNVYLDIDVDEINSIVENVSDSGILVKTVSYANDEKWKGKVYDFVNSEANKKAEYNMNWNALINTPYQDMNSDVDSPIGFLENGKEFCFRMGVSNSHYHAFMIGATGSGKSRFLHDIILSMTIKYKPEDLELYLLDFKGVEFSEYKDFKHVRTVLVNRADEQITYEVIKDLKSVMEERERILRNAGASDVAEFNRNKLGEHLSQIILIADECQTLFADRAKNGNLQNEIVDIIALIAQQGRAYGVHLLLATQSLANAPQLGKEILNQISDYYILPCLPEDAIRLVPDYARSETEKIVEKMEKGKGQCYYRGAGENFLFTYNYVPKGDMQKKLMSSAIEKAESQVSNGQIYFSGSLQFELTDNIMDNILNKKGHSILASPGQEISLNQKPITIPLKEDFSENILLTGKNDDHFVTRTTMNILTSLMIANAKKNYGYRFVVFDCLLDDEADYCCFLEDLQNNGLCELVPPRQRGNRLKQLCDEIVSNNVQPTILLILGQEKFRDLKLNVEFKQMLPDKDDFAGTINLLGQISSNAKEPDKTNAEIKNVRDALSFVLEQGPENNVHTIMQLDKISNYLFSDYVRKDDVFKYFKHLILLRSEADTAIKLSLRDDIHLEKMEDNPDRLRAYYYNEESDKYKLFTPFVLPTIENVTKLLN